MASMNKIKSIDEINTWLKSINANTLFRMHQNFIGFYRAGLDLAYARKTKDTDKTFLSRRRRSQG
jgi:hypothetical protein